MDAGGQAAEGSGAGGEGGDFETPSVQRGGVEANGGADSGRLLPRPN